MAAVSADLSWLIIRNNNAHLLKKRNIKKPFSTVRTNSMHAIATIRIEHDDFLLPSRSLIDHDYNFICYAEVRLRTHPFAQFPRSTQMR